MIDRFIDRTSRTRSRSTMAVARLALASNHDSANDNPYQAHHRAAPGTPNQNVTRYRQDAACAISIQ